MDYHWNCFEDFEVNNAHAVESFGFVATADTDEARVDKLRKLMNRNQGTGFHGSHADAHKQSWNRNTAKYVQSKYN